MATNEQLQTQLRLIESACRNYDTGLQEAALHIAVALRVLIHETSKSHSLLGQLALRYSVKLLSTFPELKIENDTSDNVLTETITFGVGIGPFGFQPPLGNSPDKHYLLVDGWWNEIVHEFRQRFSRGDIILTAANQDGGAHIAPNPRQKTILLRGSLGTLTTTTSRGTQRRELTNPHFSLIRQFGFEILNSPDLSVSTT
jgi:hypothetical protein